MSMVKHDEISLDLCFSFVEMIAYPSFVFVSACMSSLLLVISFHGSARRRDCLASFGCLRPLLVMGVSRDDLFQPLFFYS